MSKDLTLCTNLMHIEALDHTYAKAHDMQPQLIFKNKFFAIIDKPVAMLSVPSRLGLQDPRPVAGIQLQTFLGVQVFPLHRLDEDTSGLLMFALTPRASQKANFWFQSHEIKKTYEALSEPINPMEFGAWQGEQTWQCKLMRGKKRAYEASFGKPAVTTAQFIEETKLGRSRWLLKPITGRSHQLRFEMARHGFPIDGDALYGSKFPAQMTPGIDLRAVKLDFRGCSNRVNFELPEELVIGGLG
jgi:tRNA pseudouridine32 synthase / 23S rRNA pseudouridine746 synthase